MALSSEDTRAIRAIVREEFVAIREEARENSEAVRNIVAQAIAENNAQFSGDPKDHPDYVAPVATAKATGRAR